MAANLFAYGTLMFPEVAARIAAIQTWGEPVTLERFTRCTVRIPGRTRGLFPAVIPAPNERVNGLLYRDVSDRELALLDEFEGVTQGSYVRELRTIDTDSGICPAFIYVCGDQLKQFLSGAWSPLAFREDELDWYISHIVDGFADDRRVKLPDES